MIRLFIPLLFLQTLLLGQEDFSFPIYFEDAIGHKDTVFFGYDSAATDTIDAGFGEVDISQAPWDTTLDVRLAGVRTWQGSGQNYVYPFESKKVIAGPPCDRNAAVFTFKIFTRHWPVTASWDSTLFQGTCLSTTTFSGVISDVLGGSRRVRNGIEGAPFGLIYFSQESGITFTKQKSAGRASFSLPSPARVTLIAYKPSGERAAVLLDVRFPAGSHERHVDASVLPRGVYFYRLQAGEITETRKILLAW